MTTFAFERRASTQNLRQPETQVSLFEPLDHNDADELKKCDTASKDSWTSPPNTAQSEVRDEKNTSCIGLIYLKPVVGYSTTIYFHPTCRHQKENRYAVSSLFYRNWDLFVSNRLSVTLALTTLIKLDLTSCRYGFFQDLYTDLGINRFPLEKQYWFKYKRPFLQVLSSCACK